MEKRIKKIRKTLDLTQQEFAERIGVKRNTVATYEMGKSKPSDSALSLICREFNVNEEWLRTGIGQMFKPTLNIALDKLKKEYNLSIEDSLLIEKFVKMKSEKRAAITEYILEVADSLKNKSEDSTPLITPDTSKVKTSMYNPALYVPDTPEELEALYPPIDIKDVSKFDAG